MPICLHVATRTAHPQTYRLHTSMPPRPYACSAISELQRSSIPPSLHAAACLQHSIRPYPSARLQRTSGASELHAESPGPQRACRAPEILCTSTPARLHRPPELQSSIPPCVEALPRVSRARPHRSLQRSIPTYLHVPGSVSRLQRFRAPELHASSPRRQRACRAPELTPRCLHVATPTARLQHYVPS